MALNECIAEITGGILRDCDNTSMAGLEANVVFINSLDINRTLTTKSPTDKLLLTNLALKTGKKGFLVQGVKQINSGNANLVVNDAGENRWAHGFTGTAFGVSLDIKKFFQEMGEGASIVAVLEIKGKGKNNADAFQVLGFVQGMNLSVSAWSTAENDGAFTFELTSTAGYEEATVPLTLLETDYETTLTSMNNLFASA